MDVVKTRMNDDKGGLRTGCSSALFVYVTNREGVHSSSLRQETSSM